jgi:MscS family membrane protein
MSFLKVAAALPVAVLAVVALSSAPAAGEQLAKLPAVNPGLGPVPPDVVRITPASTWRAFYDLASQGQFSRAAHLLDLSEVAPDSQRTVGGAVAEKLFELMQKVKVRRDAVTSDEPEGPKAGGEPVNVVVAARFEQGKWHGEIWLQRVEDSSRGESCWLFSRQTVSSVPFWYRTVIEGYQREAEAPLNAGLGPVPAEVNRGTPRVALTGLLDACRAGRFDRAAHYLDLSQIPAADQVARGQQLARRLLMVLLRSAWVDPETISDTPLGAPEIGLPEEEERFGVVKLSGGSVELKLRHRWEPDRGHVWTVAPDTVAQIDHLYERRGYGWLGDHAPVLLFAVSFAGVQLWQWLALAFGLVVGWVVSRVLGRVLLVIPRHIVNRTSTTWDDAVVEALDGPLGLALWAGLLLLLMPLIGLSPESRAVVHDVCRLLGLLGLGWFLVRLVDGGIARLSTMPGTDNEVGLGFLPVLARFSKTIIVLLVGLAALDVVGVKVMGVVAGVGLGGIALAFAAQKTLENMFGTAAIAGDRPFQVGDFVAIGSDTGTVEDVGLRSTRLRTMARTLVTIPNGVVVAGRVENFTERDRILYNPTINLTYDTTAAQMRAILEDLRSALAGNSSVHPEGQRVRFRAFAASSLDVEILCYVATREWAEYLRVAEDLNFAVADIVERNGSSFAFPTRTVHLAETGPGQVREASERGDG